MSQEIVNQVPQAQEAGSAVSMIATSIWTAIAAVVLAGAGAGTGFPLFALGAVAFGLISLCSGASGWISLLRKLEARLDR